jgi:hypothetical protein
MLPPDVPPEATKHVPKVGSPTEPVKVAEQHAPWVVPIAAAAWLLFSVAATILSWGYGGRVLLLTVGSVFAVGLLAVVLARALVANERFGFVLALGVVAAFSVITALFITSAFFGLPSQGAVLVARILRAPEILTQDRPSLALPPVTGRLPFSALPTTIPAPEHLEHYRRIDAVRRQPALIVDGGVIEAQGPGRSHSIVVHSLTLKNSKIVTNGADLTVEVVDLFTDGSAITSFEHPDRSQPNQPGRPGGRVTLIVHGRVEGRLRLDLGGEAGAPGQAGERGANGPNGERGSNAASGLFDCRRGAGRGGPGGAGQPGHPGTDGRDGGDGGTFVLVADGAVTTLAQAFDVVTNGGQGGAGGPGGPGGQGGSGGPGGSPVGLCSGGGPSGADGPPGASGAQGPPGKNGSPGVFLTRTLDAER